MYGLLLALLSAFLFGASTPASKLLLGSFQPFQLAGLLYLGAAVGMAPVVAFERRRGTRMVLNRTNAARLGGAVLFGGILGPVLLLFGLRLMLAGSVSLLLNLEMVATALASPRTARTRASALARPSPPPQARMNHCLVVHRPWPD